MAVVAEVGVGAGEVAGGGPGHVEEEAAFWKRAWEWEAEGVGG